MKWILIALLIGCTPAVVPGDDGADGEPGEVGPQGIPGADGSDGINGAAAAIGETGPQGSTGPQGIQGEPGAPGLDGIDGADGTGSGWVLRDKDGNVVDYEVTPGSGEMFTASDCVRIISDDQGRSINMEFALANGDTVPCSRNRVDTWRERDMYFLDSACRDEPATVDYSIDSIITFIVMPFYPVEPTVQPTLYYHWTAPNGPCSTASGEKVYKYEPVPTDVLTLMQDGPYSLEWE